MSFNTSTVNEIKTVIKYILIQYREENNSLIRTMRQIEGEKIKFPEYTNKYIETTTDKFYTFFIRWIDSDGNTASDVVSNSNKTYYAENIIVNLPLSASIQVTGDSEDNQSMINDFEILSSINLYLRDTSYLQYIVKPTCEYLPNGTEWKTKINFKIQDFKYSLGAPKTLEPEFMLYKNSTFTEKVGKVLIKLIVHSSGQSSGD